MLKGTKENAANKERTERILRILEENNIEIIETDLPELKACTLKTADTFYICIDKSLTPKERKTALYHEIGHIFTNTFYTIGEPDRKEAEEKATLWSIENIITCKEYEELLEQGYNTKDKIAKYLGITAQFADKIIEHYRS